MDPFAAWLSALQRWPAGAAGQAASVAGGSERSSPGARCLLSGSPEPSAPPHRAAGLRPVKGRITATTSPWGLINELLFPKVLHECLAPAAPCRSVRREKAPKSLRGTGDTRPARPAGACEPGPAVCKAAQVSGILFENSVKYRKFRIILKKKNY